MANGKSKLQHFYHFRNKVGFHDEWVRDVNYSQNINYQRIVSGGEDKKVKIWKKQGEQDEWSLESEIEKEGPVWRVQFAPIGNLFFNI
jgi:WD40 repeat protein